MVPGCLVLLRRRILLTPAITAALTPIAPLFSKTPFSTSLHVGWRAPVPASWIVFPSLPGMDMWLWTGSKRVHIILPNIYLCHLILDILSTAVAGYVAGIPRPSRCPFMTVFDYRCVCGGSPTARWNRHHPVRIADDISQHDHGIPAFGRSYWAARSHALALRAVRTATPRRYISGNLRPSCDADPAVALPVAHTAEGSACCTTNAARRQHSERIRGFTVISRTLGWRHIG